MHNDNASRLLKDLLTSAESRHGYHRNQFLFIVPILIADPPSIVLSSPVLVTDQHLSSSHVIVIHPYVHHVIFVSLLQALSVTMVSSKLLLAHPIIFPSVPQPLLSCNRNGMGQ